LNRQPRPALLVVVGPTGSGKSDLAHEVARLRRGEIVSADAFAVYRGLDIGTAKPSAERRAEVSYHLIDMVDPAETFSAGLWGGRAREIIENIACRGRLPIVCGGSGFYLSALLSGLPPGAATDTRLRSALARWAGGRGEAAHRFLSLNDPLAASRIPPGNLRYMLRALEILLVTGRKASDRTPRDDGWTRRFRLIRMGLSPSREDLYARIAARVRQMLQAGWDAEVRRLIEGGVSLESNAFRAIGYREVADWVEGRTDREETEKRIVTASRQLAKRQKTWFRRQSGIEWVAPEEALTVALARLDEGETEKEAEGR
jgi:tRNA dimethylallyltransferase